MPPAFAFLLGLVEPPQPAPAEGRLFLWRLFLVLLLLAAPAHADPEMDLRVLDALNGDTLRVLYRGREVRLRLHGIWAPAPGQPYHAAARRFASRHVRAKQVHLVIQGRDPYGQVQLAGEVFFGKQRDSLNELLVDAGLAWADRRVSDLFMPNEEAARQARRGLWRDRAPVPPWEFERGRRWRAPRRARSAA